MIEKHLDYLQCNVSISEADLRDSSYLPVGGIKFYPRGYADSFGFRYYYGNPKSKKALVVGGGKALQTAREYGFADEQIVRNWLKQDASFTRLDIAVTEWVSESLVQVSDVQRWFRRGLVTSSWAKDGAMAIAKIPENDSRRVETLYIGSMKKRAKRGIFRAYNKGLELNLGDYMATRLEIEDRQEKAHASALRIAQGHELGSVFRSRFDVNDSEFQRIMDAPSIEITRGAAKEKTEEDEKMANRWEWLINQVAPSLKDAIETDVQKHARKDRILAFMEASGLMSELMAYTDSLADWKYSAKLRSNELVERKKD